jgi:hypothetical protein
MTVDIIRLSRNLALSLFIGLVVDAGCWRLPEFFDHLRTRRFNSECLQVTIGMKKSDVLTLMSTHDGAHYDRDSSVPTLVFLQGGSECVIQFDQQFLQVSKTESGQVRGFGSQDF